MKDCSPPTFAEVRRARNRRNAQRSTGPRSLAGKQRSAQNARQLGLSVRPRHTASCQDKLYALARLLCSKPADPIQMTAALDMADAFLDLHRIWEIRAMLADAPAPSKQPTVRACIRFLKLYGEWNGDGAPGWQSKWREDYAAHDLCIQIQLEGGCIPPEDLVHHHHATLRRLADYERRAFGRFRRAQSAMRDGKQARR